MNAGRPGNMLAARGVDDRAAAGGRAVFALIDGKQAMVSRSAA